MKKWLSVACVIVAICFLVWTAGNATDTLVKTKTRTFQASRALVSAGSASWTLASIEADTDSCVFSSVFDLTGAEFTPKNLALYIVWAGAAGGSTSSSLGVTLYAHGASTSTAGSNATQIDNRIPLGAWQVAANDTATINVKATAAGEALLFPVLNASPYSTPTMLPRYISVAVQKEGNGLFSAGTVTVYFYPYQD